MKVLMLLSLSIWITSCVTKKYAYLEEFSKEGDCSSESLNYFNANKNRKAAEKSMILKLKNMMVNLSKDIKACYQEEINNGRAISMNICFVAGYDKNGKQEFFQMSSSKVNIGGEFGSCLEDISRVIAKNGDLENISILQPFRLYNPIQ